MHAAEGGTIVARGPCQAHALSGSCQDLLALAPAESVTKGFSSGETTYIAAPRNHHTTEEEDWKVDRAGGSGATPAGCCLFRSQ